MKILMAPMNMANMPMQLVKELRARGHTAEHVQYTLGAGHKFGYELDNEVNIKELGGRINAHAATLQSYLERDFDIFHFWNKSLFFENYYKANTGMDIPLIKSRNKRIAYRFTGYDARLPSRAMPVNKYSPFHYGFKHLYDEDMQKKYLAFLEEYVDQFIVQDPEMGQFAKNAKIVPRALNLTQWIPEYPKPTDMPVVVHAPSKPLIKGTQYVEDAVKALQAEGLKFEYKRIENLSHNEAKDYYKKADIIIDQLLIGATGVLTLEGWALGKPVIVYLREDLFNDFYDTQSLPIGNGNPDNIKETLKQLVEDYDLRLDLGRRGRKLVETYHHLPNVADGLEKIYIDMMAAPVKYPAGVADVEYLRAQTTLFQTGTKDKNPNHFMITRKNETGIIRAARNLNNAVAINKKINASDKVLEDKKNHLADQVDKALIASDVPSVKSLPILLKRINDLSEKRDDKYKLMQKQINHAIKNMNNNKITVNKAQFQSLNADERLVLLSHLLPKWVITMMKPLIVIRRVIKYRKISPGK